ncbi:hypothetical protein L3X38_022416 [Prunus dulcis]|uniref:Uncharacterized protein n=1 Tax=Prunus dulcis TaxID=3755 RepID=A0AAD4Z3I5_PRUDU|nr:hypothetical protein L3X38_022416 [Prunus dulcis]
MRALIAVAKKNIDVNSFFTMANSLVNVVEASFPTMDEEYVIPRRSQRNAPMKANYHHYRVEIFIHVIDRQLAELNDRFNEKRREFLSSKTRKAPFPTWSLLSRAIDFNNNQIKFLNIIDRVDTTRGCN